MSFRVFRLLEMNCRNRQGVQLLEGDGISESVSTPLAQTIDNDVGVAAKESNDGSMSSTNDREENYEALRFRVEKTPWESGDPMCSSSGMGDGPDGAVLPAVASAYVAIPSPVASPAFATSQPEMPLISKGQGLSYTHLDNNGPCGFQDLRWLFPNRDHPNRVICMQFFPQSNSPHPPPGGQSQPPTARTSSVPGVCCCCRNIHPPDSPDDWWQPFTCEHWGHILCLSAHLYNSTECPKCRSPCTQLDLFPRSPGTEKGVGSIGKCPVCWDLCTPDDAWRPYRCEHFGHESCLRTWNAENRICPVCKGP